MILRQPSAHEMPTIPLQLQIYPANSSDELLLLGEVVALSRWTSGEFNPDRGLNAVIA
jgi:hypothetical protein